MNATETEARGFPMNELRKGAAAYIAAVEASGELVLRLTELGYFPGERVEKVLESPLGDPCAYLVRGTVTAIRSGEAGLIRVFTPSSVEKNVSEAEKWG